MECKYLKKISGPLTRVKSITLKDDASTPEMWLCRYEVETQGPEGLVRHCPFKLGPHEKCLFASEGGPFPPEKKVSEGDMKPPLKIVT